MNIKKKFVLKIIVTLIVLTGLFYGGSLVYNKVMNLIPGHAKPPQGTGDPGNVRLNRLAADPIFHSLPPGCHQDGKLQKSPATWDAFYRDWQGLGVTLDFTCPNVSQEDIYNYYVAITKQYGWIIEERFSKPYPTNGADHLMVIFWNKNVGGIYTENLNLNSIGNGNSPINLPSAEWELGGGAPAAP